MSPLLLPPPLIDYISNPKTDNRLKRELRGGCDIALAWQASDPGSFPDRGRWTWTEICLEMAGDLIGCFEFVG